MKPEEIGIPANKIILGKHSGRHAFRKRLEELGYFLGETDFQRAFKSFKNLADKKKYVFDEDIEALISDEFVRLGDHYKLIGANFATGTDMKPVATVKILTDEGEIVTSEYGDGPVDAVYKAIEKATGEHINLESYIVSAITGGTDALGEVHVRIEQDGIVTQGQGSNTDILVASAKAFVNALNKLRWRKNHPKRASAKGI
jgi:2-isopropylmalate synthase